MKKVGLLISGLNIGGAERVVSRLTSILNEDYEVYLIVFENTYILYEYSGKLINLGINSSDNIFKKLCLPFARAYKLKRIKLKYDLDIVISFMESPNIVNVLSKVRKCKTVISIRNYPFKNIYSAISSIKNVFINMLYSKADKIVSVTQVIKDHFSNKNLSVNNNKISVIYNPYNIKQIQNLAKEEIEEEYKDFFGNNESIFITVGRHMYQKGFWHLLKAFKIVQSEKEKSKLVIVGKDYQYGKVVDMIGRLGIGQNVLLIDQHDNPFKFINRSSVYILTSLFEGFPNAMVEAMACGCPIIASDCKSGPREILYCSPDLSQVASHIELADFGILVPPLNSNENWDECSIDETDKLLANSMLMYLNDKELHNYYAEKSLERAKSFSYETCKEQYKDIINA